MSKMTEDLKAAGWVETTLGECRPGEEVVIVYKGRVRHEVITRADEVRGTVSDARGFLWAAETPAQRPPRPEYEPGTVALITWDTDSDQEADLLPMRAIMGADGVWHGSEMDLSGKSDRVEVVRVLLPADQDTPTVEITDEMVERAAEACYYAREEDPTFCPEWGDVCEEYPALADLYRREARAALEAALEVEK